MEYALLALTVLIGSAKNILTKIVKNKAPSLYDTMNVNMVMFTFAFITVFLIGIAEITTTFYVPWILAICYAACTLGSQVTMMKAYELGSVSISSLFYYCGFLLPTFFGSLYYGEPINAFHILGLVLIVASFVCSTKKDSDKKFNFGWLFATIGGMLFSGVVGILQKLFTNEYSQYKLNNFLCVSFIFIILMSGITVLILQAAGKKTKNESTKKPETINKNAFFQQLIFTIAIGVSLGLINIINTYLSGVLPSIIVFPIINGGYILITTVMSALFFKEKLSLLQKISLLICILGIVAISVGKAIA